ncbi:protein acetyllysine N-acetyltransferase [Madurella fahalii]|uniref:protein acetyllysine N-acetyltransferase n=1 Tax=Madurella fahalii TaxID=1157608 RepID=A0ABQ0GGY1_9PEZI
MADTAPRVAEAEISEPDDVIDQKAQALADLIRKSKHFIVFTGAGVSTSAGISDFRGPQGVWTLRAQGRDRDIKSVDTLQAIPTPTHMALVELQNRGVLKYLVSQNCDGLHRKSGILPDKISELHGNSNREYCKDCGQEYIRDFRAVSTYQTSIHDHRTGRKCALCSGPLLDSIINFTEPLPPQALKSAFQHAKKADLCLVLGSSLTVSPANEVPEVVGNGRRRGATLAICNLQSTPLDGLAAWRVRARTDELMVRVMEKLGWGIPGFVLRRRLLVTVQPEWASSSSAARKGLKGGERHKLLVAGLDVDGTPATFLKSVRLVGQRREVKQEPFAFQLRAEWAEVMPLRVELEFMGHYGEPGLAVEVEGEGREEWEFALEYNTYTGEWKTNKA